MRQSPTICYADLKHSWQHILKVQRTLPFRVFVNTEINGFKVEQI